MLLSVQWIREYKKNSDGIEDIIHKETDARIVLTADGKTVQIKLDEIEENISDITTLISGGPGSGHGVQSDFSFIYYDNKFEFPNIGNIDTLYIIKTIGEEAVYRWDSDEHKYYIISNNYHNITVIDGGCAEDY